MYTPAHTQTGMRATKVKVEHMEDRLYIHRNYCLQVLNGKTGLEHLTSLAEITWKSRRQDNVSLSTSEAEFVAASQAGQEALYLRETLKDFGYQQQQATKIYEDNLA